MPTESFTMTFLPGYGWFEDARVELAHAQMDIATGYPCDALNTVIVILDKVLEIMQRDYLIVKEEKRRGTPEHT